MQRLVLPGLDSTGRPRQDFARKLAAADVEQYIEIAAVCIEMSMRQHWRFADVHWQADACWEEALRRRNPELYNRAWYRVKAPLALGSRVLRCRHGRG